MTRSETIVYRGTCDASAAVRVGGGGLFVTASDEDSVLRVYDRDDPGPFVHSIDLGGFLGIEDPQGEEADIEGAAQIGSLIYWIGSHGRNNDGTEQKTRRRLFATSVTVSGRDIGISPAGRPYKRLLRDMVDSPKLSDLGLAAAAELAPKTEGGLSIEGLAAASGGDLLIGFRNPVPKHRAIVVRLHNPKQLIEGTAERAEVSLAALLDLGGRGIRAIERAPGGTYVIVGGSFDGTLDFRVYRWSGHAADAAVPIETPPLDDLKPEELILAPDGDACEVELLSDDSDRPVGDKKCKKVKDEMRRTFRGFRFRLPMRALTG